MRPFRPRIFRKITVRAQIRRLGRLKWWICQYPPGYIGGSKPTFQFGGSGSRRDPADAAGASLRSATQPKVLWPSREPPNCDIPAVMPVEGKG